MANKDLKFLQSAIKDKTGKKARVWYSDGALFKSPKGTITIYAKEYGNQLPSQLKVENETDLMTDYFDKDKARITPRSKYYKDVLKALQKQEISTNKILAKRKAKYGWT